MTEDTVVAPLPEEILAAESLPSLPSVAIEVIRLTRDDNASLEDLGAAISSDPALSIRILKLANSSHFRRGAEITTLPKAMVMLGLKTVKLMALSFSLSGGLDDEDGAEDFDYRAYWRHSSTLATTARALARRVKNRNADEAFLCGLLAHIGKLVLARAAPDIYTSVLAETASTMPPAELEHRKFGYDSCLVGGELLARWELPRRICQTVRWWRDAGTANEDLEAGVVELCHVLAVAEKASQVICESQKGQALQDLHSEAKRWFHLKQEEIDEFLISLESEVAETATLLDVDLSGVATYQSILEDARQQMVQLTLGAAIEVQQTASRTQSLERERAELEKKANTDRLTGIANRAAFDTRFEALLRARLQEPPADGLAVLLVDVDHFKRFNDEHGHHAGDEVLRQVARALVQAIRADDLAARYGGEEFAILLSETTAAALSDITERVRSAIAATRVTVDGKTLAVTASVGGAHTARVEALEDADLLLRTADSCLYEAKHAGRNRCVSKRVERETA